MDRLVELYDRIISSKQPVPPQLQRQMVNVLAGAGAYRTLGELAERGDTCDEIDAELGQFLEPDVIRGWARRPGRQNSEITERFASETKIGNLLPIARTPGLAPEIYAALGRKDSLKLAEALTGNPDASPEAKLARIEAIMVAIEKRGGWRRQHDAVAAIGNDPRVAEAVLRRARSAGVALAALAVAENLHQETVELLVSRLEGMTGAEEAGVNLVIELLEAVAMLELDDKQLKKVRSITGIRAKEHGDGLSYWAPDFSQAKFLVSAKGRQALEEVRNLGTADPETVERVLRNVAGKQNADNPLETVALVAAARNPRLTPKTLKPVIEDIPGDDAIKLLNRWMADGHVDDVLDVTREYYSAPWWLDRIVDPLPLLRRAAEKARTNGDPVPSWVVEHPLIAGSPRLAIELLPWHCLADADEARGYLEEKELSRDADDTRREDAGTNTVMTAVLQLLEERLGSDPVKWDTFRGLADEFQGTLGELLDTAATV